MKRNEDNGYTTLCTRLLLLTAVCLSLLLSSCRDTDNEPGGSTKLITVDRLSVSIEGVQSGEETTEAADAATTTAGADGIDEKGYLGSEKKKFVPGDVLHFRVELTDDGYSKNHPIYNATLQPDGTTWLFDKPIVLPQDATETFAMQVFYDGKQDKYSFYNRNTTGENDAAHGNYNAAIWDASNGTTDASGYTSYPDMLEANGRKSGDNWSGSDGITLTPDGTLTLTLRHRHSLVRISSITNLLETEVEAIEANVHIYRNTYVIHLLPPPASSASPAAAYDAIIGSGSGDPLYLHSFTVTFHGGRTALIPVPDGKGGYGGIDGSPGRLLSSDGYYRNCSYTYRLLLLPGSLSAVPDDSNAPAFRKRRDPAVPAGYIPIYTAEDLRNIGTNKLAVVRGYLYTNASSAILAQDALADPIYNADYDAYTDSGYLIDAPTGNRPEDTSDGSGNVGPLTFSLNARYILMNDIDLTPASGAIGMDLNGIENVRKEELWKPIGDSRNPFTGRFNGNGFTIRGMTIYSDAIAIGLFGKTQGAVIYNVHMRDARVKNTHAQYNNPSTGSLAGICNFSTLSLCSAIGCAVQTGQSMPQAGDLVGMNNSGFLTRCSATICTISGNGQDFNGGGLVGYNFSNGILASCYTAGCTANCTTNKSYTFGGLASDNKGIIYGCYATYAKATGSSSSGALVGHNSSIIASSYAINAAGSSLGLVGSNDTNTNTRTIACVSPFSEALPTPTPPDNPGAPGYDDNADGQDNGGGSYWKVISISGADGSLTYTGGYAPLTDLKARKALYDLNTSYGQQAFTDRGNLAAVRTIRVNNTGKDITGIDVGAGENIGTGGGGIGVIATIPPGGLYVVKCVWRARGIWGGDTAPTSDKNPTTSLPRIDWQYDGEGN